MPLAKMGVKVPDAVSMRLGRFIGGLVCQTLVAGMSFAAIEPGFVIEKDIPSGPSGDYIDLFPTLKFYPGQTITFQVVGQIDVNHRYWQDRQCNWLGAHCWYEDRDAPNFFSTDTFPALLTVVSDPAGGGLSSPKLESEASFSQGAEPHLAVTADQRRVPQNISMEIRAPNSGKSLSIFAGGITAKGKISDRGANGVVINRATCIERTPCSAGSYKIRVINIDNSLRLADLKSILSAQSPPDPGAILPSLDRLFTRDPVTRPLITDLIFRHAVKRYETDPGSADLIQFLEFAAQLDIAKGVGEIGNALATAYLRSGNIAQAKAQAETDNPELARQFAASPANVSFRTNYINNIRTIAAVKTRERSGLYSGDLIKAVALYLQASKLAEDGATPADVVVDARRNLLILAYESLVDAMRTLMMERTVDNIIRAEALSARALKLAAQSRQVQ